MTSNNDCCVRLFDVEGCRPRQRLPFSFAVNYATLRPAGAAPGGGAVAAVVGDDPLTWLVDLRSGLQVGVGGRGGRGGEGGQGGVPEAWRGWYELVICSGLTSVDGLGWTWVLA